VAAIRGEELERTSEITRANAMTLYKLNT
jgi:hypothetical protein